MTNQWRGNYYYCGNTWSSNQKGSNHYIRVVVMFHFAYIATYMFIDQVSRWVPHWGSSQVRLWSLLESRSRLEAVIMQYEAFHSGVRFTNPSFQKWAFDQSISLSTEVTLYTGRLNSLILWIHYGNREWQSMNIWEMNTLGGMEDVMLCLRAWGPQPINAMHEKDPPLSDWRRIAVNVKEWQVLSNAHCSHRN